MNAVVEQKPEKTAYERLPKRYQRFVDAIVCGRSPTEALRPVAKYEKNAYKYHIRNIAWRWMQKPDVRAAIEERSAIAVYEAGASALVVMQQTIAIAKADPRKLVNADGTRKALHELDDETAAALAGIEIEEVSTNGRIGTRYKYKFWDKNKAVDKLGQHLKLWQPGTTNVNVDARSVTVNSGSPGGEAALRGAVRLLEQVRRIGTGQAAALGDPHGSVLPPAVRDESLGRGSPVDVREDSGSASEP